jgi:hypothetical protein
MRESIYPLVAVMMLTGCNNPCGGGEVNVDPTAYAPLLQPHTVAIGWLGGCDSEGGLNPPPQLPFTGADELTFTVSYGGAPFV